MVSILGIDLGVELPTFAASGFGFWISMTALICIFLIIIGIVVWIYYQQKIYYIKINDFENVAGQGYQFTGRDKARLVKIGDGGEELLLLKKRKVFRTAYGKKMGKNLYWFAKGQDGYMYNVILGDLDARMGMLDIEPIDRDMRYMHVAIRKNIQDRYKSKRIETATAIVVGGVVLTVIIMFIGNWFILSKMGELIEILQSNIAASKPVADTLLQAISKLDTLCSGSGISPA